MAYRILEDRCIGCGACAWVCLFDVPRLTDDSIHYVFDKDSCIGCGQCKNLCPNNAIEPCPDHKTVKRVTITAGNASAAAPVRGSVLPAQYTDRSARPLKSTRKSASDAAPASQNSARTRLRRNMPDTVKLSSLTGFIEKQRGPWI